MQHIQPRFSSVVPLPVACSTKSSSPPSPAFLWLRMSLPQLALLLGCDPLIACKPGASSSCCTFCSHLPSAAVQKQAFLWIFSVITFFSPFFPVAYCQCLLLSEPPGTLRRNTNFFSGEGMSSPKLPSWVDYFVLLVLISWLRLKSDCGLGIFFFCV